MSVPTLFITLRHMTTRPSCWTLALACLLSSGWANEGLAQSHIQCFARLSGFGWGDGYHACKPSGFQPLSDLPPQLPACPPRNSHPHSPGQIIQHLGTTFYDRFDAGATGPSVANPCEGCGSPACDSAHLTANESAAIPSVTSVTQQPSPASVEETEKPTLRPTRPQPPTDDPSEHQAPAYVRVTPQAIEQVEPPLVLRDSATPAPIVPSYPERTGSDTGLVLSMPISEVEAMIAAEEPKGSMPSYTLPPATGKTSSTSTALSGDASGSDRASAIPWPKHLSSASSYPTANSSVSGSPVSGSPVSGSSVSGPSVSGPYTIFVKPTPVAPTMPEAKGDALAPSAPLKPNDVSPARVANVPSYAQESASPSRLGQNTASLPVQVRTSTTPPSRLGGGEIRTNPLLSRPTVEIASERSGSGMTVTQPTRR
jgi:hypothetical protein